MNTSAAIYTISAKFEIGADTFEKMYSVFMGDIHFWSLTDAEQALYWRMYNDLEHFEGLVNPRPVIVKARRTRKAT